MIREDRCVLHTTDNEVHRGLGYPKHAAGVLELLQTKDWVFMIARLDIGDTSFQLAISSLWDCDSDLAPVRLSQRVRFINTPAAT
jgi:hypothetical protein